MMKQWKKILSAACVAGTALSGLSVPAYANMTYLNGICREPVSGNWYMYRDGTIDTGCNSIRMNENGWWKIENGKVNFDYTGISNNENGWWRVENGKVNFDYNGIARNEYGWWKIENGKVNFEYTGVSNNEYGWWRVEDGKVNFGYNGITNNENGWWKIENGQVNFAYTGVAENEYGTWRIENGKVNFEFNGIAESEDTLWYLENGKVNFTYTGEVSYENRVYDVKDGKATLRKSSQEQTAYMWPLPGYSHISSSFGYRECPFHGQELHGGIDIPAAAGTSILACADGTVVKAEYSSSFGNNIVIDHGNGIQTRYCHCSALNVQTGQKVKQGDVIGYVGATGDATGNHLDLRFSVNGEYVDPLTMVQP